MGHPDDNKHALILSGGGAYGAFEIGVLRALLTDWEGCVPHRRVVPKVYTGTSIGALNAAVMVSQNGLGASAEEAVDYLEDIWLNLLADDEGTCGNGAYRIRLDPFWYLNPRCLTDPARAVAEFAQDSTLIGEGFVKRVANFFASPDSIETRALEFVDLSAWVSPEPFYRFVREVVSLEAIRRSSLELRIVAANWETGEVRVFKNEDMTDEVGHQIILASAAVPGFFPPVDIGGDPYVDGGVVMNTPLRPAIQAGANVLHIVYLSPGVDRLPLKVLQNTYNTLDRTILINSAVVINEDIATASWINEGLDTIARATRDETLTDADARNFIRVAAQIEERIKKGKPYKKLSLHRYHPDVDPGGGGIGVLNFNRERVLRLMELGFKETADHDCEHAGCLWR
jgi:NTE family protein